MGQAKRRNAEIEELLRMAPEQRKLRTQIAAVLPANTPIGLGNITVSRPGQANIAALIEITAAAPGLASYYGTGSGPAIATDPITGSLFTPTNSAKPGQTIVLWGSGTTT